MNTYENDYFDLRIDFPDAWKLTSWRHKKIPNSWQGLYQTSDDDLPTEVGKSKFLFTATLHPPESQALVNAGVELSICRLAPNEGMRSSLVTNFERQRAYYESNGIYSSIINEGVWNIGNTDFTFVDQESKSLRRDRKTVRRQSWYRFFFRKHHEGFWLYGKIDGHEFPAYQVALEIVEGLTFSDDGLQGHQ